MRTCIVFLRMLTSFNMLLSRVVANARCLIVSRLSRILFCMCFIPPCVHACEHLERSPILTTVDDSTINIGVQISLQHLNFSYHGYMNSFWITRSSNSSAFSCLERYTVVYSYCAIPFHQQCQKFLLFCFLLIPVFIF